jgi:hypothetical protein
MTTLVKFIKNLLKCETAYDRMRRERDEYLAQSTDLVDLERRMRQIDRNENLKGWV